MVTSLFSEASWRAMLEPTRPAPQTMILMLKAYVLSNRLPD